MMNRKKMKAILMSILLMMGMTAQAQDVSDILNSVLGDSSTGDVVSNGCYQIAELVQNLRR